MNKKKHEYYLKIALDEAKKALKQKKCPVGAVLVDAKIEKIISKSFSLNGLSSPLSHAEINAINNVKGSLLRPTNNLVMYTTLEPCVMCVGTLVRLGVMHFIFGQRDWNMWHKSPLSISPYLNRKIKTYEHIDCYFEEYYELYFQFDKDEAKRVFNIKS